MSFSEILKGITDNVQGSKGALIVGMDGIIVDEYSPGSQELDLGSIGAEYGNVLKEIQNASVSLQMGGASEVAIMTEEADLIIRKINDEYFVVLLLTPRANLGKGRFFVRTASRMLEKEF